MKILFILPSIGIGGGVRIVIEYANHLVDRGHDVSVIYPYVLPSQLILRINPNQYFIKKLAYSTIKTIRFLSKPKLVDNQRWFGLKAKLIEVPTLDEKFIPNADAIVATWWETSFYVNDYGTDKGNKFYLVQGYEVWGGPKQLVHETYKLDLTKIVVARWLYYKLKYLGVPENQMQHIPNAINFDSFKVNNPIKTRTPKIAMQFNDNIFKGAHDGIKALEIAKKDFPKLNVVLFGVSPRPRFLPGWMNYIQEPSQEDLINKVYNQSSIYLCPSLTEGWHLPPAEAMACGCAIVSTDIGGVKDYAINNETALLAPRKNPTLLAQNLLNLLKNNDLRIKLAFNGNEKIKQFNWEKSTDLFEHLLKVS